MRHQSIILKRTVLFWLTGVLVVSGLLPLVLQAAPQAASKTSQTKPKSFATPQQAAEALVQAAEQFDVAALEVILGSDGHDIIVTGEPARDKEMATQFAAEARTKMGVSIDPRNKNRVILSVGNEDWPLPTPIVKLGRKWSFDAKGGRRELLYRRIGRQ